MKNIFIPILILFIPAISFSEPWRIPLLTNGYNIVTGKDIDELEQNCTHVTAFPPKDDCTLYWQCLPTQGAKVSCEDLGPDDSPAVKDHIGELKLVIKNKLESYQFRLRHNFGMFDCKDVKHSIFSVMKNEKIVCISGEYIGKENFTSHWIIDRVKSERGESGWFHREKKR
jgi:hypothetical protein